MSAGMLTRIFGVIAVFSFHSRFILGYFILDHFILDHLLDHEWARCAAVVRVGHLLDHV
jgi:hypothetical protein